MDERHHIAQAKKGDKSAYRALVEAYQDRLFALVGSLVSHPQQAEDLTQEIFIKAYFALPSFKGDSAFYTWLFRIASNHCVDYLRRNRPPEVSLDETLKDQEDIPHSATLTAPVSEGPEAPLESRGDVCRLLDSLDPGQRLVLSLREIEGRSYEEMAGLLNCAVNTIKSRLNRARESLKKAYIAKYGNILETENVQIVREKQDEL